MRALNLNNLSRKKFSWLYGAIIGSNKFEIINLNKFKIIDSNEFERIMAM